MRGLVSAYHDSFHSSHRRILAIAVLLGLLTSLASGTAFAQDEDAAGEPVVVTEAPPPLTEAPPPTPVPTEPPPPPTAVPTEAPAPTDVPATDVPAVTEIPATEQPTEQPTGVPTEEPSPTPTVTPESTLTWTLAAEPDCRLADGESGTVASGAGQVYTCTSRVLIGGEQVVPASVGLDWTVRATSDAGWIVQLLPPKNDSSDVVDWTSPKIGEGVFTFSQRDPLGTSTDPAAVDRDVEIAWSIRLTRPACNVETPTLRLTHGIAVTAPGTTVKADPAMDPDPEPLRIAPTLANLPEPDAAFAGSLDFGEIGATASGLTENVRTGTLSLNLTGLAAACGDWSLTLAATPLVDAAGSPLTGSALVVTAVNGNALAGGPCDLATGCTVATLAAGPSVANDQVITLTVELWMPDTASLGAFGTTIDAALQPAGANQGSDTPSAMRE